MADENSPRVIKWHAYYEVISTIVTKDVYLESCTFTLRKWTDLRSI